MNNVISIKARHANEDIEECSLRFERYPQRKLFFSGVGFREQEFSSGDLFEALKLLRRKLEKMNVQLLCNGARRDVYPSNMGRDMHAGLTAYIHKLGYPATERLYIFDYSDDPALGSVSEQKAFQKNWRINRENKIRNEIQNEMWDAGKEYLKSKGFMD